MTDYGSSLRGHVFIAYVHEDRPQVDRLHRTLADAGIPVWRDSSSLWPGEDWRIQIREAISLHALVFIACFSENSLARQKSYQNEELMLAFEQFRMRNPKQPWLIPVRLDNCEIPDWEIGSSRTLRSLQWTDLFGDSYSYGVARLVALVQQLLGKPPVSQGAELDQPKNRLLKQENLASGKGMTLASVGGTVYLGGANTDNGDPSVDAEPLGGQPLGIDPSTDIWQRNSSSDAGIVAAAIGGSVILHSSGLPVTPPPRPDWRNDSLAATAGQNDGLPYTDSSPGDEMPLDKHSEQQ